MTCRCGVPAPHLLLDPDGAHPLCDYCVIQLLAAVQGAGTRLTLTVEPARVAA